MADNDQTVTQQDEEQEETPVVTETEPVPEPEDEEQDDEEISRSLFGRKEILTAVDTITKQNVVDVLHKALGVHYFNASQIDYLYR